MKKTVLNELIDELNIAVIGADAGDDKFIDVIKAVKHVVKELLPKEQKQTAGDQLLMIQGYYSKIQLDKLSIDDVLDLMEKDMKYLKETYTNK